MSDNTSNKVTQDPVAIDFILKKISDYYPKSFHYQVSKQGYTKAPRMSVIETAAVLSEVGVADKFFLNTLQNHMKAKYGHQIFCPHRDLNVLTSRLPKIICNETLVEKEEGIRKEGVGIAYIDTIEAIRFDMDRYIVAKFKSNNIFDPSVSNIPLFCTKTPSHDDGTYVMIGTDHG